MYPDKLLCTIQNIDALFFFKIHNTYTCNSDLHKLGRLHLLVYGLDKEEAPLQKIR